MPRLEIIVALTLFVCGCLFFAVTFTDQFDVPLFGGDVGPAFAPRSYLVVWIVIAGYLAISGFRQLPSSNTSSNPYDSIRIWQLVSVVTVTILIALLVTRVGFLLTMIPGIFLFGLCFGYRKIPTLILLSLIAPILIFVLFNYAFELVLPKSPWFNRF